MKQILPVRVVVTLAAICISNSPHAIADGIAASYQVGSSNKTLPWDLVELNKPPEFTWGDGKEVRSLYYSSEPYQGKVTRVFAYYATPGSVSGDPSKDENLPALVLVHGGGGRAFADWAKLWASRGYAAIAMDLAGCGRDASHMMDGGPDQGHDTKFKTINLPVTEQWSYHAVANVIRAHSLIRTFSEVDSERTAITGISWGGYLTCIVAGLDNRFSAAVPVYGCGYLHENSVWLKEFSEMTPENRAKWVRLWDPSQYIGSAVMPMLFVNGGNDGAYYPDSYAKTYTLVRAPKNIHFVPELPHGHIFDRPQAIEVFINAHLKGGTPLARVTSLKISDQVEANVDAKTKLSSAELHYTQDALPGDSKTRTWGRQPATIEQTCVIAGLPPDNATIWFLTVTDERGTTVSSQLVFP